MTAFFAPPEIGDELILPTAHILYKEGHRFAGWFTDLHDENSLVRNGGILHEEKTLYALWLAVPETFRVGAVTGNGRVTSADATAIARYIIGNTDDNFCILAADLDGSGYVSIADVSLLLRWLVGHDVRNLIAH
jgi:hypothetical protein